MKEASVYAGIVKMDENADGTLTVYGKATDSGLDIDQQICDPVWLDKAMPEWFMTGGNIREQHSNVAAGVAQEYEQKDDGHYISALVVDPVSVKKVKSRVLKGFSIGIKAPRVVKDQKAANGRIIDGQIVEVSLVDRPANPNCQLLLAKSVEGEASLVKVEEIRMATAKEIVAEAKKYAPADIVKFDKDLYEKVRTALAQLIMSEANEMITEGHNEEESLGWLLGALHNVFAWYEHEEAEGEVKEEIMELSADTAKADDASTQGCDCEGCKMCKTDGGCDMKMCKGHHVEKELVSEDGEEELKTAHKCLECGCNMVANNHGGGNVTLPDGTQSHMTSAVMSNPNQMPVGSPAIQPPTPKSAESSATADEVTEEKNSDEQDSSEQSLLADGLDAVIEKAVKSAMTSVQAEIASLKSAKEAVENKAASLETELAAAKSLAIGGGPKRTTIATGAKTNNEWRAKADLYLAKASATTDNDLAKGYREMAKDYLAKAANEAQA